MGATRPRPLTATGGDTPPTRGAPAPFSGPVGVPPVGFQYQFADMPSRANHMLVTFVNPELDWAEDVREVKVDSYIEANGRIPMDFVAVGCIDPFEAQRRAYARLLAANTEVTTVTFATTRLGIMLEPYDIIGVSDPHMNWGLPGRIKSIVGSTINLRDPLFLTVGGSYTMALQTREGPVDLTVVNADGNYSRLLTITAGTVPVDLQANAQFALTSGSVGLVKPFRVLTISESEGNSDLYNITAVEINENKYTDADNMTLSPAQEYAFENSMIPARPAMVQANSGTRHLYRTGDGGVVSRIYVTWEQDPTSFTTEFEVFYRRQGAEIFQVRAATGLDCYIDNVEDGVVYEIYLRAVNAFARRSPPTSVLLHTVIGKLAAGFAAGKGKNPWIVGWGMVPRGEVGLIFAMVGKGLGVMSESMFSVIVIMVILTTLLTPPILTTLLRRKNLTQTTENP